MIKPHISVILPVYNAAFSIEETIKSITSQNYRKIELICVDDGSNDNSVSKIKKLQNRDKRIQLLQFSKNSGISEALNFGIKNAKGKYIARIDSDDLAETNRLEIQKQFLDQNPRVAIVGSWIQLFGKRKDVWHYRQASDQIKSLLLFRTNGFPHNSILCRKEVFKEHSYDSYYDGVEDTELWCRIIKKNPNIEFANIPKVLTKYRVHDQQTSHKYKSKQMNLYRKIIKSYVEFFCDGITQNDLNNHYNLIEMREKISEKKLNEIGQWKLYLEKKFNKRLNDRFYEINNKWHKLCRYNQNMNIFERYNSCKGILSYI
ncbi:MAG: hypothetical protein CMI19_02325 [Opitutae bacterium]|nr:hypothetical protein [Opitutae bacterium]|tara:strand:+ start:1639 stop:2589 length:951 start_codon:yes stop_codon:yes gene_type:complete